MGPPGSREAQPFYIGPSSPNFGTPDESLMIPYFTPVDREQAKTVSTTLVGNRVGQRNSAELQVAEQTTLGIAAGSRFSDA